MLLFSKKKCHYSSWNIKYIVANKFITLRGWWDGSEGKSTRLLFWRSRVQIPATTWWLTTICNEISRPLLVFLKTATVYLDVINKSLKKKKNKRVLTLRVFKKKKIYYSIFLCYTPSITSILQWHLENNWKRHRLYWAYKISILAQ
jgi:hypothetical protein